MPEVYVIDLPEDPSDYVKTLMELNDFNTLQITEEDKKRNRFYIQERQRKEHKERTISITEYLKDLEMVVTIAKAHPFTIPRISQLTQKTNQFNMTTRRYTEEDIKKLSEDDSYIVVSIKVEDKFGDNGITGAAIVKKDLDCWIIDTFLLSCRVIGKEIERVLFAYLLEKARKDKAKVIVGEFISTNRNAPAKDFYKQSNFTFRGNDNNKEIWEFDVSKDYKSPHFIKVI